MIFTDLGGICRDPLAPLGLLFPSLMEILWGILGTLGYPRVSGGILGWILESFFVDLGCCLETNLGCLWECALVVSHMFSLGLTFSGCFSNLTRFTFPC